MKKILYFFILITIPYGCDKSALDFEENAKNIEISKDGQLLFKNEPYNGRVISNTSNEDGVFTFEGSLFQGYVSSGFDIDSHLFKQEFIDYLGLISIKLNPVPQDSIKYDFRFADSYDTYDGFGTVELPSGDINFESPYYKSPYILKFKKIISEGFIKFTVEYKDETPSFESESTASNCQRVGIQKIENLNKKVLGVIPISYNKITYTYLDYDYNIEGEVTYTFDNNCNVISTTF